MHRPTVLIVDDHAAFRAAAHELLTRSGFMVIGEADSGRAAVRMAAQVHPTVVILDVRLPDLDGFEVTRQLLAGQEPPAIVLVSTREATDYGRQLRDSGARGFITKSNLSGDTLHAILRGDKEAPT